jgi:LEA14-like dessication related protein
MMDYEFENVRVAGIGKEAVTLSFELVLENTSDLDVKIYNVDFKVLWNNTQVGKVNSRQAYIVPKRSTKVVPLTLTLSRNEMNEAIRDAFSSLQSFVSGVIKIQGSMDVGADVIKISNFPFDYEVPASNLVGNSIQSVIQ